MDLNARPEDRCVHFLALEAEDLGFEVEWLSRTTGAAADDAPYASRTCRLTHAGWDGPVVLDFLAICGLVQISAVHGDKRSRSDVAAAAPRAAVLSPATIAARSNLWSHRRPKSRGHMTPGLSQAGCESEHVVASANATQWASASGSQASRHRA